MRYRSITRSKMFPIARKLPSSWFSCWSFSGYMYLGLVLRFMIVVSFATFQASGANVLAHWALNGSETGLTLHGGPTFVDGRYPGSKAINFNQPSNCYARIPKVELRDRSFTIALWVKVESLPNRNQVVFSDWYNPWQFFLGVHKTGVIQFVRHSTDTSWYAANLLSSSKINPGKWFHIAVTWDQSRGISKVYIDAKENKTIAIDKSKTWRPPRNTYEIGDDGHSEEHQLLGSVMDLYIIHGLLNSEEINHLRGFLEITSNYLHNTFVYVNETVKCQAKGSPTPYVAWVRSGSVLVNKTSTAEITITENNGEYVCVASNREGEKKITVNAKAPLQLCHDYHIMSDVSRAVNHIYQPSRVNNDNTDIDLSKWYRIQSPAGNQLPTTCVPQNRCGTQAPGWLNGPHPSIQDGIVKRTVCFHLNGNCCYQATTIHIKKCFGYYVYKFSGVPEGLPGRYCIENQQCDNRDHPDTIFRATKEEAGSSLIDHVMHKERDVPDVFTCMNYCQLYNGCKSFNFDRENKICELNNATRQEHPDAFQKKNSSVTYFEKIYIFGD